jgi:hypothetical protein
LSMVVSIAFIFSSRALISSLLTRLSPRRRSIYFKGVNRGVLIPLNFSVGPRLLRIGVIMPLTCIPLASCCYFWSYFCFYWTFLSFIMSTKLKFDFWNISIWLEFFRSSGMFSFFATECLDALVTAFFIDFGASN